MNRTQLVDAVMARTGDRRAAAAAVDAVLGTIVATVAAGEPVSLLGFGTFEGRPRAARTARNPRTGVAVAVAARTVPAFRPGAAFRAAVDVGRVASAESTTDAPAVSATERKASAGKRRKAVELDQPPSAGAPGQRAVKQVERATKPAKVKKAKNKK